MVRMDRQIINPVKNRPMSKGRRLTPSGGIRASFSMPAIDREKVRKTLIAYMTTRDVTSPRVYRSATTEATPIIRIP